MNDISDEAFEKWYNEEAVPSIALMSTYSTAEFARAAWHEAVKRTQARDARLQNLIYPERS